MSHTKKIAYVYNPDRQPPEELVENFVIRIREFNDIFNDIKGSSMKNPEEHYIIQGPRGSGKTTLLYRIYYEIMNNRQLSKWLIPVMFSEEQFNIRRLCSLWEHTAELLEEHDEFAGLYEKYEEVFDRKDYEETCFNLLSHALQEKNKKIVLFVDNIGDMLNKLTETEHHRLREVLMTSSDIRIIGASSITLEHTYDYSKPFFDFFKFIYLKNLKSDETNTLLINLGKNYKEDAINKIVEKHPERIEVLRRLSGGIPRTMVLLFEIFADDESGDSFRDLEIILDRVTPLYKHRMEDLSAQQQEIIDVLAMSWDAIGTREIAKKVRMQSKAVSSQLKQLEKNRVIHKEKSSTKNYLYQITERFFNIWYLMRYGRKKDRNKVLWLVQFLMEWCSREELAERARHHIKALSKDGYYVGHAFSMTEALAATELPMQLQHELIEKTREFLSKSETGLINELSKSDMELLKESEKYVEVKDYKNCLCVLEKIKDKKSAYLQFGYIYHIGYRDMDKAEEYYLKAIEKGAVSALDNLATLYKEQEKNKKAEEYYLRAIEKGANGALYNLAILYKEQEEYEKAEEYYLRAIKNGVVDALYNLAILYKEQEKYEKAEEYYLRAIENGIVSALYNLANLYKKQENYEKAEEYYLRAIKNGVVSALTNLANIYKEQEKYEKAEEFYLKAIKNGVVTALYNLANIYKEQEKYEKAEEYYLRAIEKGHIYALNNLAVLYVELKVNKEKALELSRDCYERLTVIVSRKTLIVTLIWNNIIEEAAEHFREILMDKQAINEYINDIGEILIFLIAKKQYFLILKFFEDKELELKDRLKPIYYALMYFMQNEYPNEYRKMGDELKETVEEVIQRIEQTAKDYD